MGFSVNQLLGFALFLCGLEETLLSSSGRCTDNQCFAVFVEAKDFTNAQKSCKNTSGQLFKSDVTLLTVNLNRLPSGKFWLGQKEAVATPPTCSSIAVPTLESTQTACDETLTGFLCQYPLRKPCRELGAAEAALVIYTAPMGFVVQESKTFPQGTTAEATTDGGAKLESKHLCVAGAWLQAPWNCDVMKGGCEQGCNKTTNKCTCPAGQSLGGSRVRCDADPCARCAHGCQRASDALTCACRPGYRLMGDGESCDDVDECEDRGACTREGEECVNAQGSFECRCRDGFIMEEGACVNNSICFECEHMLCGKHNGVHECECRPGFQVRSTDPTKCDRVCAEAACLATCDKNTKGERQCFCPQGYILDHGNTSDICRDIDECEMGLCDHSCVNNFGGFQCACFEGFRLHGVDRCLPADDGEEKGSATASTASYPVPPTAQPALVPYYIKAGSALGITVFLLLCAALLFFLIYYAVKRCRTFDVTTLKHQNIFHLQQVTTDTYKRLSF